MLKSLLLYIEVSFILYAHAEKRILMNDVGGNYDSIQRLEVEVASLKNTVAHMNNTINSLKQAKDTQQNVAFMASMSKDLINPPTNHILVLDYVVTNSGNAYNRFTGSFISPINGIYFFAAAFGAADIKDSHFIHINMRKNGVDIGYLFFDENHTFWLKRTETVTLHLNKGDIIYLVVSACNGNNTIGGGLHSNFSGFLVRAD